MKTPISNSGVKQQKDILSLLSEWHELLRHAKSKYSFRGRFDADEFNRCIKGAYHYFVTPDGRRENLTTEEIKLYGVIYAYSQIPSGYRSAERLRFRASTYAALELANMICDPSYAGDADEKITAFVFNDTEGLLRFEYNLNDGDLSDFMRMAKAVNHMEAAE